MLLLTILYICPFSPIFYSTQFGDWYKYCNFTPIGMGVYPLALAVPRPMSFL